MFWRCFYSIVCLFDWYPYVLAPFMEIEKDIQTNSNNNLKRLEHSVEYISTPLLFFGLAFIKMIHKIKLEKKFRKVLCFYLSVAQLYKCARTHSHTHTTNFSIKHGISTFTCIFMTTKSHTYNMYMYIYNHHVIAIFFH